MLINSAAQGGPSSPPCDTADANNHGDTMSRNPGHRDSTATVAANTAATASANPVGAANGAAVPGSTSTAKAVNPARTDSARSAKRRSHPRTVDAGRPTSTAICRCPQPAAFATSDAPITSTTSARRDSPITGSNT
ncbi:hypothetical protein GCM10010436_12960 [Paractinoplanes durhamensis]|nr:hypothetical protein [Actinoplanes durhamensis]